jgi:uncharacterized protein (TIGR02611 family)
MSDQPRRERPDVIERLLARREHHKTRSRFFRVAWGVAATLILLGGVVMLVTPGPAFVLIPIGLAMLALEFVWAERLLDRALEQAEKAKRSAQETTRTQRALAAIAAVLVVGAAITASILWEIPVVPYT